MKLKDRLAVASSTALGIGFFPIAPGTMGSLPGLLLAYGLSFLGWGGYLLYVLLCLLGHLAIQRTEAVWGSHDDSRIVLDEVLGQALAVLFVPMTVPNLLLGFLCFRILDIWKPSLIGVIDRDWPGAFGTLYDDILAGACTAVLLWLISFAGKLY